MSKQPTNRQRTAALNAALTEVLTAFAQEQNMSLVGGVKLRFNPNGELSVQITANIADKSEGQGDAGMPANIAELVAMDLSNADALGYPKGARDVIQQAALQGRLFRFDEPRGELGRITGYNARARKTPILFTQLATGGTPCEAKRYKCVAPRLHQVGVYADASDVLDIQVGDPCFVDYTGDDSDPEDQSGFYSVVITDLGTKGAEVTYKNGVTDTVPFDKLIVRPRFI